LAVKKNLSFKSAISAYISAFFLLYLTKKYLLTGRETGLFEAASGGKNLTVTAFPLQSKVPKNLWIN
jgi:hypothetical protein